MAEITFDKFWGGMTPTSLYANPGECAYLEGVDVTQNISNVKNTSPWSLSFLTDGNDMITNFVATGYLTSREWYSGEGGQIYTNTSDDNIPEKQLTNTRTILDSTSIGGGIYLIQKAQSGNKISISRMDENNASLGSVSGFLEGLFVSAEIPDQFTDDTTSISSFGEETIVAIAGAEVFVLRTATGPSLVLDSSFNLGRAVVGVSATTDFIKFYTKDGRILMYNKAFTLVSETQTGELFHDITTSNNRDYVVGEDGIYYVEGNNLVPILKDGQKGLYDIQNNREIFQWRTDIYVPVDIPSGNNKLLRIGTDNAGFPEAITILPTLDANGEDALDYYGVGGRLTLSAGMIVQTTGKGVYTLNGSTANAEGKIYTQKFNAGSQVLTKEITEIIVSGKFEDGSTVSTIINDDEVSATQVALNNLDDRDFVVRTEALNDMFLDLSIVVDLKGGDRLYGITLRYNVIKR